MTVEQSSFDDRVDLEADVVIKAALSLDTPQSFFLYAGAGSGKTGSLKTALDSTRESYGEVLRRQGRKIGVITYTKAARDEILRRVDFDALFHVATIHSFAWTLIEGRTGDIRGWLEMRLPKEVAEIEAEQARGRASKASEERARKITSKLERLLELPNITKFVYNPDGDNFGRDSLSHTEVIDIVSDFIFTKPAMKNIILGRYPFLLIDESQDTLLPFIDALLAFEEANHKQFAIGLFGDTMQRIYGHGKENLAAAIPPRWKRPQKVMNHRSRERIVALANRIRSEDDGRQQRSRTDKKGGFAFAYILPADMTNKPTTEERIRVDTAVRTGDPCWRDSCSVKTLTLEHHMAASRLGFLEFFDPIDKVSAYRTSFRDGTLPPIRLFTERVLPLVDAHQEGDRFGVMGLLRSYSPLVSKQTLKDAGSRAREKLGEAQAAVDKLVGLFSEGKRPSFGAVLGVVQETGIFPIPEALLPFSSPDFLGDLKQHVESEDELTGAWAKALQAEFSQARTYREYVNDQAPFGTHQGVKGLQFPRVMVIADDSDSRFRATASYEKLLGAAPLTKNDRDNIAKGKETQIERTRRLLYVTCTRAEESLVLVVYSDNPDAIAERLLTSGWFEGTELIRTI